MALIMTACGNKGNQFDATGTFEATETTVFAEHNGALLSLNINEGDEVTNGQEVGLIDTTQVWLQIQQLTATKEAYQNQKPDLQRQIAATRQQLAQAQLEQKRYQELVNDEAVPAKMLDDATNQVLVLQKQLDAQISSLSNSSRSLDKQVNASEAQVNLLKDQLRKCHVTAPIQGTVLEKYVERGEFVSIGKPILKIADIQHMFIRAYVTSSQLQNISLGQSAKVMADFGNKQKKEYEGKVTWISSRSEFTPKTILTDDERADLVYAVKVAFPNDGLVKIGMYGEVKFK